MNSGPLLRVDSLTKTFNGRKVLDNVSFSLARGEVLGMLGSSGSGKSTLLRCLNLLERPDSGQVWLGEELIGMDRSRQRPLGARALARQRVGMAMVFQHFNLWPHRTALENVTEGLRVVQKMRADLAAKAGLALLEQMGLQDKAQVYPITLSGGQQQRVAIARALAMAPELILFDEPTSALDPELVSDVLNVMTDLAQSGTTMIVVTHEITFAMSVCHRILLLDQGRIADNGTPQALLARPATAPIHRFISSTGPVRKERPA